MILHSEVRASEYRARADAASELAAAAVLPRVSEKHALAASVWNALAQSEDARTSYHLRALSRPNAGPRATATIRLAAPAQAGHGASGRQAAPATA